MTDQFWSHNEWFLDQDGAAIKPIRLTSISCALCHNAFSSYIASGTSCLWILKPCLSAFLSVNVHIFFRVRLNSRCIVHLVGGVRILVVLYVSFVKPSPSLVLQYPSQIEEVLPFLVFCWAKLPNKRSQKWIYSKHFRAIKLIVLWIYPCGVVVLWGFL